MKHHVQKNKGKKHKGSVAVEYMALTAFVGLGLVTGATSLGNAINTKMLQITTIITDVIESMQNGGGGTPIEPEPDPDPEP